MDNSLISRQAAIDALTDMHCKSDEDGYVWIIRSDAWARIDALPSAQPTYTDAEIQKMQDLEQAQIEKAYRLGYENGKKDAQPEQRWIPCSEKPPEEGYYLVWMTFASPENKMAVAKYNGEYWGIKTPISAYMPLPEPYGGEA